MFIPNTDKFVYPEDTSSHYMEVHMDRGIVFDKNYPYIDNSFSFRFIRFWVRILLRIIVFPVAYFKMGIKINGKSHLRKNKKLLKSGAITIANHVHRWDYICVMKAVHNYHWPYLLSWDKNVNGEDGPLVRLVGGIPIPLNDIEATVAFSKTLNKILEEGNFLHIYPEGSMWEYYTPIRPFKRGAFSIAIKNNKPILPMAFSYRKPGLIRRILLRQKVLFTLNIGEPIFADSSLSQSEQIDDLIRRSHRAVCFLAGFNDNNIYEPIYNNSKKKEFKGE